MITSRVAAIKPREVLSYAVWKSELEEERRAKRRAEVARMKANSAQLDPDWLRSNANKLRSNADHLSGSFEVLKRSSTCLTIKGCMRIV